MHSGLVPGPAVTIPTDSTLHIRNFFNLACFKLDLFGAICKSTSVRAAQLCDVGKEWSSPVMV